MTHRFKPMIRALRMFALVAVLPGGVQAGEPAAQPPGPGTSDYFARAYCLETGRAIYDEHHFEIRRDGRIVGQRVGYYRPDGSLIAEKALDFTRGLSTPSFELVDRRSGYREGASWGREEVELFAGKENLKRSTVEVGDSAVIDAGFHRFVQQNLVDLAAGVVIDFDFAVPSLGRFVRFRVASDSANSNGESIELTMSPVNRLVRWLVDPIALKYSRSGRLLEFRGLSNVKDDRGGTYTARIVFEYPEDRVNANALRPERVEAGR